VLRQYLEHLASGGHRVRRGVGDIEGLPMHRARLCRGQDAGAIPCLLY
jgi:hypothetical protein